MTEAARGLRDVELMDEVGPMTPPQQAHPAEVYFDEEDAALFSGEGAPADEWNIGAVLDEELAGDDLVTEIQVPVEPFAGLGDLTAALA